MRTVVVFYIFTLIAGISVTWCVFYRLQQELYYWKTRRNAVNTLGRQEHPMCRDSETFVQGPVNVSSEIPTWEHLERRFAMLKPGGSFVPLDCQPKHKIAVIIPIRNREDHLKLFLQHMHPFLQRQNLEYTVYVVELEQGGLFKKSLLMNAGFIEVSKMSADTQCFVFHDVDMLPQHTGISYACVFSDVKHPATYVKQYKYRRFNRTKGYLGGVLIFPKTRFEEVNGFSNKYWGWGPEDDDMFERLSSVGTHILEPSSSEYSYMSWDHWREQRVMNWQEYVNTAVERMYEDGINSAKYHVLKQEKRPLYTWMMIASNLTDDSYKDIRAERKPNPQNKKLETSKTIQLKSH